MSGMEPIRIRDVGIMRRRANTEAPDVARQSGLVRTYRRGRRCACGTVLSRYNPRASCSSCEIAAEDAA